MATTAVSRIPTAMKSDDSDRHPISRRNLFWFVLVVSLIVIYPFFDSWVGLNRIISWEAIFVFVMLAMGLNIVVGYAGLLDLGYAAFFAIGAYSQALLTSPSSKLVREGIVPEWLQGFWQGMAVSWFIAAIFGVLLGAPTLRLRGDYLAIVTLGFGEIVPVVFLNAESLTGGAAGINPIARPPTVDIFGWTLRFGPNDQRNWYFMIIIVGLFSLFLIRRLYNSRLGRSWQAVREDEIAAASMGVDLVRTKLWAFGLGASFSGFAGGVYASAFQIINPDQFQFSVSIMVLSMVILGGLGNIYGVIVGGMLIGSFDRIMAEELNRPLQWLGGVLNIGPIQEHSLTQDRFLVFGGALVLMMLLRPGGLFPSAQRRAEMVPESEDILSQEDEQMPDVRKGIDPAGERL